MNIIFLEAVQNFGGARMSTLELAKRMQDLGHNVLIVDFWGANKDFVSKAHEFNLPITYLKERPEPFVIKESNSKLLQIKNYVKYIFLQREYKAAFKRIAKEFKPDVVNVNNNKCLNILDVKADYKIDYFARGWFAYKSLSIFNKKLLKKYKPRFLTVSQSTRQAIYTGGIAPLKDIVVFTDVMNKELIESYTNQYYSFSADKPIKILHSGGFLKTKGQHIAVEVAKALKDNDVAFKMTLTGIIYKGDASRIYYESVVSLIKKYNLENEVEIVLNKPNVIEYFKKTDVLIHPSWTEGLPRVALEALSFGKPVIANPVGGIVDVVINNITGYITDFNNIEQYVEYIKSYYDNIEKYKSHSQLGRHLIKGNYLDEHQLLNIKRIYPIK